jgi:multidrug efflux system membrane fusion protein
MTRTDAAMTTTFTRHRTTWSLVAIAAAVLVFGLWSVERPANAADDAKDKKKQAPPPVTVTVAPVKVQDMPIFRIGIGTVTPTFSVTVKTRVDGQLDSVGFNEGDDVKKGQVIARIDPRTYQAQLLQAEGTRAKDQATLANARTDLQRYTTLIAQDAATQQQLDTQKSLVAQLEATVKSDDAAVKYAQVQLDYTTITAPISGRVGTRLVDPGNIVHAADTTGLVVINQIDPISVQFTLPEDAVQDTNRAIAKTHQPLFVKAFSRDSSELLGAGTLTVVNNQIDTTSGTVQMKGSFPNPQHNLWPGQYVNVRLILGTYAKALTIPAAAVQRSQTGVFAFVLSSDGQTVRNQTISVVQIEEGVAIVGVGLSSTDKVVTDGLYQLQSGSRVTLSKPGAAASGAAGAASAAGDNK